MRLFRPGGLILRDMGTHRTEERVTLAEPYLSHKWRPSPRRGNGKNQNQPKQPQTKTRCVWQTPASTVSKVVKWGAGTTAVEAHEGYLIPAGSSSRLGGCGASAALPPANALPAGLFLPGRRRCLAGSGAAGPQDQAGPSAPPSTGPRLGSRPQAHLCRATRPDCRLLPTGRPADIPTPPSSSRARTGLALLWFCFGFFFSFDPLNLPLWHSLPRKRGETLLPAAGEKRGAWPRAPWGSTHPHEQQDRVPGTRPSSPRLGWWVWVLVCVITHVPLALRHVMLIPPLRVVLELGE